MLKKLSIVFLSFILICSLSCNSATTKQIKINDILPRQSFLFVKKVLTVYRCVDNVCSSRDYQAYASAYVVDTDTEGALAVTAAHVCHNEDKDYVEEDAKMDVKYKMLRLDGTVFEAVVLNYNIEIDACMLFVKDLVGVEKVELSKKAPKPGDKVYNLAAPRAIFRPEVVPILEGRFNGDSDGVAWYSLLAAPGSSGSMIINENGELVGMVHSTFTSFPVMTLSVQYDDLKDFINSNIEKYNFMKFMKNVYKIKKFLNNLPTPY